MSRAEELLERALAAEEARDAAQAELDDLKGRLRAALGADPTTAVSALGFMTRCQNCETLVESVLRLVDEGTLHSTALPQGWVPQARAQIKARELARKAGEMFDRPADTEYWQRTLTPRGRAQVRVERRERQRRDRNG